MIMAAGNTSDLIILTGICEGPTGVPPYIMSNADITFGHTRRHDGRHSLQERAGIRDRSDDSSVEKRDILSRGPRLRAT